MKRLFAFIGIIILFCECKKVPYNPVPVVLAVYTIGSGDSCANALVSGRYVADTALAVANTVTITVNVTVAGPYLVSTNTVNGISFSQESTFADTGLQKVILVGTGMPVAIDTATFTVTGSTGSGDSCSFSVATVQGIPPHYYLSCFLNGVYRNFSDSTGATNSEIPGISGYAGLDIRGLDTVANSASTFEFGVSSAGLVGTGSYTDSTSAKAYSNYLDNLGQTWSADTTANSSFNVVVTGVSASNVQGTFSGTIRSLQGTGTDSIVVTNGMFSVAVH